LAIPGLINEPNPRIQDLVYTHNINLILRERDWDYREFILHSDTNIYHALLSGLETLPGIGPHWSRVFTNLIIHRLCEGHSLGEIVYDIPELLIPPEGGVMRARLVREWLARS
jgi:hypothetical protein